MINYDIDGIVALGDGMVVSEFAVGDGMVVYDFALGDGMVVLSESQFGEIHGFRVIRAVGIIVLVLVTFGENVAL